MPAFIRGYRGLLEFSFIRGRRSRLEHDQWLIDPRVATEHRIAHYRSLDEGGEGCSFCKHHPF